MCTPVIFGLLVNKLLQKSRYYDRVPMDVTPDIDRIGRSEGDEAGVEGDEAGVMLYESQSAGPIGRMQEARWALLDNRSLEQIETELERSRAAMWAHTRALEGMHVERERQRAELRNEGGILWSTRCVFV